MFWTLLLGHLIADYPLQSNTMVEAKRHLRGLLLHVFIHIITLFILTWGLWGAVWIYIAALGIAHFCIDTIKNIIFKARPDWIVGPYVFDQFLHLVSLLLISAWASKDGGPMNLLVTREIGVFSVGFLLATHVWFITERVIFYGDPKYVQDVTRRHWSRMFLRGGLLFFFILIFPVLSPFALFGISVLGFNYPPPDHGRRVLLIDFFVPSVVAIMIQLLA